MGSEAPDLNQHLGLGGRIIRGVGIDRRGEVLDGLYEVATVRHDHVSDAGNAEQK